MKYIIVLILLLCSCSRSSEVKVDGKVSIDTGDKVIVNGDTITKRVIPMAVYYKTKSVDDGTVVIAAEEFYVLKKGPYTPGDRVRLDPYGNISSDTTDTRIYEIVEQINLRDSL